MFVKIVGYQYINNFMLKIVYFDLCSLIYFLLKSVYEILILVP